MRAEKLTVKVDIGYRAGYNGYGPSALYIPTLHAHNAGLERAYTWADFESAAALASAYGNYGRVPVPLLRNEGVQFWEHADPDVFASDRFGWQVCTVRQHTFSDVSAAAEGLLSNSAALV